MIKVSTIRSVSFWRRTLLKGQVFQKVICYMTESGYLIAIGVYTLSTNEDRENAISI